MVDVQVNLKLGGINKVMRAAQPVVDREAQDMAARAGEHFEAVSRPHKWTARAYVQPKDPIGMRQQARDAVLERALR